MFVALLVTACAPQVVSTPILKPTATSEDSSTVITTATKSIPEPQEPSLTSTSIPTILPTPSFTISFEERLLATIDIKYPDEIAFVQGFIWVKTDDGHVMKVDPFTNSVVGDIKVDTTSDPYHYCQGLGTDGEKHLGMLCQRR